MRGGGAGGARVGGAGGQGGANNVCAPRSARQAHAARKHSPAHLKAEGDSKILCCPPMKHAILPSGARSACCLLPL